jgi:hypothetical protein
MILDGRAHVFELSHIKLEPFSTDDLGKHERSYPIPDSKAVGFGDPVNMIDGDNETSSRHVLDNDCRTTWDIFAHVACNGPGIGIETASWSGSHDDPYCLAFVEGCGCVSHTRQEQSAKERCC